MPLLRKVLSSIYILTLLVLVLASTSTVYADTITWSYTFSDGSVLTAAQLEQMKTDITTVVNAGGGPVGLTNSQTVSGAKVFSGAVTFNSTVSFGAASVTSFVSGATVDASSAVLLGASPLVFEGSTADAFETTLAVKNVTADVTYNFQADASTTPGYIPVMTSEGTAGQFAKSAGAGANSLWAFSFSQAKLITSTRDFTAASGDVAYTGVGFTPKVIVAWVAQDNQVRASLGLWETSHATGTAIGQDGTNWQVETALLIHATQGAGTNQNAILKTADADGFTLTWTKVGSPTGTVSLIFLCLG